MASCNYKLSGFREGENKYLTTFQPMGYSAACQTFENVGKALQWIRLDHFYYDRNVAY